MIEGRHCTTPHAILRPDRLSASGVHAGSVMWRDDEVSESTAGARFQIPLEANGSLLVREFDDDVQSPRSARCGVWTAPRVVVQHPRVHIGRETDVEAWVSICVVQNVDKSFVCGHGRGEGKADAWTTHAETRRNFSERLGRVAVFHN